MQITVFPQNGYFTAARRVLADSIFPEGKEQRNRAERAANTDALTGLANRRAFDLAQPTAENDHATAFIVFDVNNFKLVNDELNHKIGDDILKNISQVLKLAASRYAVAERVFRYGGDEFVIICPASIALELRDVIEAMYEPFRLPNGQHVSISGTVGATFIEADEKLQDRKNIKKRSLI